MYLFWMMREKLLWSAIFWWCFVVITMRNPSSIQAACIDKIVAFLDCSNRMDRDVYILSIDLFEVFDPGKGIGSKIIKELERVLEETGASKILKKGFNSYSIDMYELECDLYNYEKDKTARNLSSLLWYDII